jgi:putative aminopeptidase FrvX
MNSRELIEELVAIPGPPGQERLVCEALQRHVDRLGLTSEVDAKGNLFVWLGDRAQAGNLVVAAHMDEIAMIVRGVMEDGSLTVSAMGGLLPWKIGEGPVLLLAPEPMNGVLSFGSIHTDDPGSSVRQAEKEGLDWPLATVITGRSADELLDSNVRPGTRVVLHPCRRTVIDIGPLIGSHFLDDRADLVAWLLALEALAKANVNALFLATAAEEVGGEGALFAFAKLRPDICIALELGPSVTDAPVELTDAPTLWVTDSYSTMSAADIEMVVETAEEIEMDLQFQALSRGGSDATCAASHGLVARPITLGLAMENSHGFEVMHPHAMDALAELTVALVRKLG